MANHTTASEDYNIGWARQLGLTVLTDIIERLDDALTDALSKVDDLEDQVADLQQELNETPL